MRSRQYVTIINKYLGKIFQNLTVIYELKYLVCWILTNFRLLLFLLEKSKQLIPMTTLTSTVLTSRRKIALLIGNQNYRRPENRLRHSINDVDDLSAVLRTIKFHVRTEHDLTNSQMVSAIPNFTKTIVDGDLVLFYFSGHGYQINGRNYLMHVDDDLIETDQDVENYATSVERSLHQLTQKNSSFVTVFILDCCRLDYPKKNKTKDS